MLSQFLRFCVVGTVGFVVDAGSLQGLVTLGGLNPYLGRVGSYLLAATTTWWLNRRYTFTATVDQRWQRQWGRYLVVNAVGAAVNYGVYALALWSVPLVRDHLYLGVAAGSVAGLAFNFTASRSLVFQGQREVDS